VETKARNRLRDFPLVRRIGEACFAKEVCLARQTRYAGARHAARIPCFTACKRKPDLRRGAVLPEFPQIPRGRVLRSKTAPKGLLGTTRRLGRRRKKTAHRAVF
jgi:hypothetical protein